MLDFVFKNDKRRNQIFSYFLLNSEESIEYI